MSSPTFCGLSISTKSHAPATLCRSTICLFFFSRAFHAAEGDVLKSGSGDVDLWFRGERRLLDGRSLVDAGERSSDRSKLSTSGDTESLAIVTGDVRSNKSIAGGADTVLLKRGEVRRLRVVVVSLILFVLLEVEEEDDIDFSEACEALEDSVVKGGRTLDDGAVRRMPVGGGFCICEDTHRTGDEIVKSKVSTSSAAGRSSDCIGIGAASETGVVSRSFVGVAETRHASNVVCLDFPGDEATEVPRGALVLGTGFVALVLAFLGGNCEGEGSTGESTKSNVSIVSDGGGVLGRPSEPLVWPGSVWER